MTAIESVIKEAVEKGGYVLDTVTGMTSDENIKSSSKHLFACEIFLDPAFWRALAKARGWKEFAGGYEDGCVEWLFNWHRFIDHLASGGDAESFFKELI